MPVCVGGSSLKSAWRRCGAYMVSPGLLDHDMIAQPAASDVDQKAAKHVFNGHMHE